MSKQVGITAASTANSSFNSLPFFWNSSIESIEMNGELSSALILDRKENVFVKNIHLFTVNCENLLLVRAKYKPPDGNIFDAYKNCRNILTLAITKSQPRHLTNGSGCFKCASLNIRNSGKVETDLSSDINLKKNSF